MNIWHDIPNQKVTATRFPVYVTITKGSNKRYEFDLETGLLQLTEMLYAAACYPVNGGIIPCTLGENEKPVEALVLCQEPLELHTLVECSPVGSILLQESGMKEEKIIALPIVEGMNGMGTIEEESALKAVYEDICFFYRVCNGSDKERPHTIGELPGISAVDRIEKAINRYKQKYR